MAEAQIQEQKEAMQDNNNIKYKLIKDHAEEIQNIVEKNEEELQKVKEEYAKRMNMMNDLRIVQIKNHEEEMQKLVKNNAKEHYGL